MQTHIRVERILDAPCPHGLVHDTLWLPAGPYAIQQVEARFGTDLIPPKVTLCPPPPKTPWVSPAPKFKRPTPLKAVVYVPSADRVVKRALTLQEFVDSF